MKKKTQRWTVLVALVGLAAGVGPALASPDDEEEERKHVIVNVTGDGPPFWSLRHGGYLGISMVDLTPDLRTHFGVTEDAGVMISSVADESPAAAADLRVGDILISVDGTSMPGSGSVARAISGKDSGEPVRLEIFRDGDYLTLEATVEERQRSQFWLNTLGDGEHTGFGFHSGDGENVFVMPGPDAKHFRFERERLDEVMGSLHERLASPDFTSRMLEVRSNSEELEARIEELEERLRELAAQLEKIED